MHFKNPSIKPFAAILAFFMCAAMLHAQNAASTNDSDTNAVTTQADSSAANTNALSGTNFASNSIPVSKAHHDNGLYASGERNHWTADMNLRNGVLGKTVVELTAIVCPFLVVFGLPVAIIVTVFYFRHRQNKLMHETIRAMVERGVPVTPELIAGLNPSGFKVDIQGKLDHPAMRNRNRHLLPGLILAGTGIALTIGLPEHSGPGGLIIFFIGVAFLIVWLVERKQNASDERRAGVTEERMPEAERKPENEPQPPKI